MCLYAMVRRIPHAIAFGMCHVVIKVIPLGHVICFLTMWHVFVIMWYAFSKPQKTSIKDI